MVVRRGSGRQKGPIRRETQSQSDIICHSFIGPQMTNGVVIEIIIEVEEAILNKRTKTMKNLK